MSGLGLVDLLAVVGREALDCEREGVDSFAGGVEAGSSEKGGRHLVRRHVADRGHDAGGVELVHHVQLVRDVGCERVRLGDGTSGNTIKTSSSKRVVGVPGQLGRRVSRVRRGAHLRPSPSRLVGDESRVFCLLGRESDEVDACPARRSSDSTGAIAFDAGHPNLQVR